MKNHVMPSIVRMEPEQLKNLVKEVKETIATDIVMPKAKKTTFGIIDLWNIRRNAGWMRGRVVR